MSASDGLDEEALAAVWALYIDTRAPEALEILVAHYEPLARYLAHRARAKAPAYQDADDLLSYAHHGLLDAISKFEPGRGFKFETYASRRITGEIIDGLRKQDPLSRPTRRRVKALAAAESELQEQLNRQPSVTELARALQTSEQEVRELLVTRQTLNRSLDKWRDEDLATGAGPVDPELQVAEDPTTAVLLEEMRESLATHLPLLSERDRVFIVLYYCEHLTLRDIGKLLGVSDSRCGQIRKEVIQSLTPGAAN